MIKQSLYIIDTMALAYRCYWAYKDLTTQSGKHTGVVYGAKSFLENLLQARNPDYMIAARESSGATFRHGMYEQYKANRKEKDPEFVEQIGDFYRLFDELGIPVIQKEGFEADDVIGSLCKKYASEHLHCYIVSPDKDFMQLVNENVSLYRPAKFPEVEILGPAEVYTKMGVHPHQIIDYLAIVGDTADNIPGVKGVGPKGAEKLLKSMGSIKGIYENIHTVQGANKKKLEEHKNNARISWALAKIQTDLNMDNLDLADMVIYQEDLSKSNVLDFYKSLEFNI